ncbi:MAG: hypothetical protein VB067_14810 [Christensenellaceae bacterium]|nr:hypothetical protein [Christensenellaceae bacterium]MEA5070261.1 hypothetical protein [Christensenellaceae bacterium]
MSAAIYDLTTDTLHAKAAERDAWAAEARAAGRREESDLHERMAGLYRLRIRQLEGDDTKK